MRYITSCGSFQWENVLQVGNFFSCQSVFLVLAIWTLKATFAENWSNHGNCSLRIAVDCCSCCLEKRDDVIHSLKQRHSWLVDCQCWGLFHSCSSRPKFNQGWMSKVSGRCPTQVAVGCLLEICTNAYLSFPVARIKYPDQNNIREKGSLWLTVPGTVHHGMEARQQEREAVACIAFTPKKWK